MYIGSDKDVKEVPESTIAGNPMLIEVVPTKISVMLIMYVGLPMTITNEIRQG